jgi:hypothetical protein
VRERGEVATRADRTARGHVRQHASVQAVDEQLDQRRTRAGIPLRERVRAQQHRAADDLARIRLADPAGMTAQEPQLELLRLLDRNRARDEAAEARVDAVGVVIPRDPIDELARRPHLLPRLLGEGHRRAADRHVPHVGHAEAVTRQRVTRDHGTSVGATRRRDPVRRPASPSVTGS